MTPLGVERIETPSPLLMRGRHFEPNCVTPGMPDLLLSHLA